MSILPANLVGSTFKVHPESDGAHPLPCHHPGPHHHHVSPDQGAGFLAGLYASAPAASLRTKTARSPIRSQFLSLLCSEPSIGPHCTERRHVLCPRRAPASSGPPSATGLLPAAHPGFCSPRHALASGPLHGSGPPSFSSKGHCPIRESFSSPISLPFNLPLPTDSAYSPFLLRFFFFVSITAKRVISLFSSSALECRHRRSRSPSITSSVVPQMPRSAPEGKRREAFGNHGYVPSSR